MGFHKMSSLYYFGVLFLILQSTFSLISGDSISPVEVEYLAEPNQAELVSYRFVPLNRVRRQIGAANISLEEVDKSILKNGVGTKKPIFKAKENSTLSISKDSTDKKTASSTQSQSAGSTVVAEISTSTVTPPMKVFPLPKTNDTGSGLNVTVWLNKTSNWDINEDGPVEFPVDQPNVTMSNHTYYTSTYYRNGQFLWIELNDHDNATVHELLSDAHRRAATVKLDFDFPFYGHMINNVTMATGGFLYLGQHVHAWLAATQYVAPLMANFDSRVGNATVQYLKNETQFTVQWHNVVLHDSPQSGPFTFQTTLYQNGTITFAYKEIPIDIQSVNDTNHPVKVGLSDAYISERNVLFVKQKTIYEYHRIDLTNQTIVTGSAFVFSALPTCPMYKTCDECTNHKTEFECVWCPMAERCSDGTDRDRQDWLIKKCSTINAKTPVECYISANTPSSNSDLYQHEHEEHDRREVYPEHRSNDENLSTNKNNGPLISPAPKDSGGIGASGVVALLFFLTIVLSIGGWAFYAYYYPHTPSGQLLIRFRPSQWGAFRRGEARYTAASIHM